MIANDEQGLTLLDMGVRVFIVLFLLVVIGVFVWILLGLLFPGLPIYGG